MEDFKPLQLKHYLVFKVADQKFAFDILDIDSIHTSKNNKVFHDILDQKIAIRLHKRVVPIINLRNKLKLPNSEPADFHTLIFLKRYTDLENNIIGIQVDYNVEIVESIVPKKYNGNCNCLITVRNGNETESVRVLRFKDIISETELHPLETEVWN